jgi:hypothetical protein
MDLAETDEFADAIVLTSEGCTLIQVAGILDVACPFLAWVSTRHRVDGDVRFQGSLRLAGLSETLIRPRSHWDRPRRFRLAGWMRAFD